MKRFLLFSALVVCLSPSMGLAAKHAPAWQSAKLLSFGQQKKPEPQSDQTNGQADADADYAPKFAESDRIYFDYQAVLDDGKMLYFGSWTQPLRWAHEPTFTEKETVRYALNGDTLTVIDDTGQAIKMKLVKRESRSNGAAR